LLEIVFTGDTDPNPAAPSSPRDESMSPRRPDRAGIKVTES
jgi:hypothetical protein